MTDKSTEFYVRLQDELEKTTEKWPTDYLYKFIIPTQENKIKALKDVFSSHKANFITKESRNGKYTSASIRLKVSSSNEIISIYKEATKIEGIISL